MTALNNVPRPRSHPRSVSIPPDLRDLFKDPPLLNSEDPAGYWAVLARFAREVEPSDAIEWMWVRDLVDLSWQIIRYRRIIARLIDVGQRIAVAKIFAPDGSASNAYEKNEARRRAEDWFDAKTRNDVESDLKRYGLDNDAVTAVSFSIHASEIEAAERMVAASEIRRNCALREIEERRHRLGRALRQVSNKIIEAQSSIASARVDSSE